MTKKRWLILSVIFLIVSLIGLISFVGGTRSVNLGAFIFPFVLSVIFFVMYKTRSDK